MSITWALRPAAPARACRTLPRIAACLVLLASAAPLAARAADKLVYPPAPPEAVLDTFGTTVVADPYRWLEDLDAPLTRDWVTAEGALTRKVLDAVPLRTAWTTRLSALHAVARTTVPVKRGSRYFFSRIAGQETQPSWYVQDGATGAPRVLLDAAAMSADGSVAVTSVVPSDDGSLVAYTVGEDGSDRQSIRVRTVASGADHTDELRWVKFSSIVWRPDNDGFYYKHFPAPGSVPAGGENYRGKIYYHHLGTPQELDHVIFEAPGDSLGDPSVQITHNGRYLIFTVAHGALDLDEIYVLDRTILNARVQPLFTGFTSRYTFLDAVSGKFYFWTTAGAPLGKIIVVDYGPGKISKPRDIVPESGDVIANARIVNNQLVIARLHNATSQVSIYRLDTTKVRDIALPELGTVEDLGGQTSDSELLLGVTSFTRPSTVYRYNMLTGALSEFASSQSLPFQPAEFVTEQVFYPSKDGTLVSMFVVRKKSTPLDGARQTWLSGYGGFGVAKTPRYAARVIAWCENGGVFAVPNLRGGGEYGETWHQAGMLDKKQNTFDDFLAAAGYLMAHGYTSPARLAIEGASNGGLLTAACVTQHPELFGAALVRIPVTDMLRFHRFTVGRWWIPEYGSPEDPAQFPFLHAYSPLHRVRDGVRYPATLITTADHDDRVFPGMAYKFAARLQAASSGSAPILLRVESKAGHGHDSPRAKYVLEDVDLFAFLYVGLGLTN